MSNRIAISVQNLSKTYRLGMIGSGTLQEDFERLWARMLRRPDPLVKIGQERHARQAGQHFWALDDVSFEVEEGGVLGIIGRNGAGKSTLLKILSQVTAPSSGQIKVRGRIASLLEVGTGFHPELTGRENIFLNGAILGMTKAEIRRKLDEIIAFSGVEQFIDTPVKRYSSGMYVRLAFAVAAHLEPEILVVDEVLAVGDAEFQAKCLGKMDEVSRQEGRTVLFVSHNMDAVATLTKNSVLLAGGRVAMYGETPDVVAAYLSAGVAGPMVYDAQAHGEMPSVVRVELTTSLPGNVQRHGEPLKIVCDVDLPIASNGTRFEIVACDERGRKVLHLWRYDLPDSPFLRLPGRYRITCAIPVLHLYAGRYTLLIHLAERSGGRLFVQLDSLCPFQVIMPQPRDGGWGTDEGVYIESADWQVEPS
ncbi:MAG: ABC transporter ATP-binding protein [Acidobacteria bacterium]|nr:ABC transporter ATP-binding protein [Acidobacteriota bacterium]